MRCSCSSDRLWVGLLFPPFATLSVFGVFFRQGSVERALEDINTATWGNPLDLSFSTLYFSINVKNKIKSLLLLGSRQAG